MFDNRDDNDDHDDLPALGAFETSPDVHVFTLQIFRVHRLLEPAFGQADPSLLVSIVNRSAFLIPLLLKKSSLAEALTFYGYAFSVCFIMHFLFFVAHAVQIFNSMFAFCFAACV